MDGSQLTCCIIKFHPECDLLSQYDHSYPDLELESQSQKSGSHRNYEGQKGSRQNSESLRDNEGQQTFENQQENDENDGRIDPQPSEKNISGETNPRETTQDTGHHSSTGNKNDTRKKDTADGINENSDHQGFTVSLEQLDRPSGILRVWYHVIEELILTMTQVQMKYQSLVCDTLFLILKQIVHTPGEC